MNGTYAAFIALLLAFASCVLAASYGWHAAITRPAAGVCAVALIACAVWLNRSAE